jgi:hypothetical protein
MQYNRIGSFVLIKSRNYAPQYPEAINRWWYSNREVPSFRSTMHSHVFTAICSNLHNSLVEADQFTWRPRYSSWELFKKKFIYLLLFYNLKRVISKRDGCEYLKQVISIDGSLELI